MLQMIQDLLANDVFNGIVGGSVVASLLYTIKWIPTAAWNAVVWRLTTTLVVYSEDAAFERVDTWLASLEYAQNARTLRMISQDAPNGEREISFSPGIGRHFIWYRGRPVIVGRTEPDAKQGVSQSGKRPENIILSTVGLSTAPMHSLITEIVEAESLTRQKMIDIYLYDDSWWRLACRKLKRSLDSVVLPEGQRDRIVDDIETFIGRKDWYNERGIPYRRGFLFEGPPGCGKTSLVMALASRFSKPVYVLNIGSLKGDSNLFRAITSMPENVLLLIEDIDAAQAPRDKKELTDKEREQAPVTLSGLLNAIDGVFSRDGRILIMTTNYPERIDAALLRPGRVDRREHIGELGEKEVRVMCRQFLGNGGDSVAGTINVPIVPANLQQMLLDQLGDTPPIQGSPVTDV